MQKIENIKKSALFKPLDLAVYAALAALIFILLFAVLSSRKEGETVEVYYDNKYFAAFDLDENGRHDIAGDLTLVIQNGVVWAEDATCKDKICMTKKIKRTNDPIYCLPNKISIVIRGKKRISDL